MSFSELTVLVSLIALSTLVVLGRWEGLHDSQEAGASFLAVESAAKQYRADHCLQLATVTGSELISGGYLDTELRPDSIEWEVQFSNKGMPFIKMTTDNRALRQYLLSTFRGINVSSNPDSALLPVRLDNDFRSPGLSAIRYTNEGDFGCGI